MGTYTETIPLADVVVGDGWVGISAITATVNGETPGPNLTRVRMVFRLGQTEFVLDSDDGEISIDSADGWEASIAAQTDFLPRSGEWQFEISFYRAGHTSPWTLYRGVIVAHPELDA